MRTSTCRTKLLRMDFATRSTFVCRAGAETVPPRCNPCQALVASSSVLPARGFDGGRLEEISDACPSRQIRALQQARRAGASGSHIRRCRVVRDAHHAAKLLDWIELCAQRGGWPGLR